MTNNFDTQPFGPDYLWESKDEYDQVVKRMQLTPYQMAREFRETFGQPVDIYIPDLPTCEDNSLPDEMGMKLIEEEFAEVSDAYYREFEPEGSSEALLKELADLVYVVYGYAAFRGWNLDKAVTRVHLSNLSKCDPATGQPIRRGDGKVLKSKFYKPPYLSDLV